MEEKKAHNWLVSTILTATITETQVEVKCCRGTCLYVKVTYIQIEYL